MAPHHRNAFLSRSLGALVPVFTLAMASCRVGGGEPKQGASFPPSAGASAAAGSRAGTGSSVVPQAGTRGSVNVPSLDAGPAVHPTPDGAVLVDSDADLPDAPSISGDPWLEPAPRAKCGAGDLPDGTLGGLNGDFRCNLSVAGQVEAPHFLSLAWYEDCAYVNGSDGTTVIHVAPDGTPGVTTTLTDIGFRNNWESMKANPQSKLLVGYEANGATVSVYDLSTSCSAPVPASTIALGGIGGVFGSIGHAGNFSDDGTVYYASSLYTAGLYAVDLTAPKKPVLITEMFERSAHDLSVGKQGTRGYFAYPNLTVLGVGSLAIMDLSEVQARKPGAKGTVIKELQWEDGNVSQYPVAVQYGGKDYLVITDELGSGNCDNPKKPQWGYARIFDISDEQDPKLVSLIKTEAQDPGHCKEAGAANGGTSGFGLGVHYCNVDRLEDPRVLACGNWDAGLRVYDIRNPARPKEVAYFDTPDGNMPGLARIMPDKREIWIAMVPSTFFVLKITEGSELDQILAE